MAKVEIEAEIIYQSTNDVDASNYRGPYDLQLENGKKRKDSNRLQKKKFYKTIADQ